MHYPRQQAISGRGGYAPNPADPSEAYVLQNLLPFDRDGIARPRPGLVNEKDTFLADIDHISIHPATEFLVLTEGGRLRYIDPQNLADDTQLATGWPQSPDGVFKHCTGIATDGTRLWIAPKCAVGANPGATIYRIDANGVYDVLDVDAPTANWVEAYGTFTFATAENRIAWSDPGKSDSWTADAVGTLHKLGEMFGLVALADNQAILLGRDGNGVWVGSNEDLFEQHFVSNQRVATPLLSAADCAGRLMMLCPGPSLRAYQNAWTPVHLPLLRELESISDSKALHSWYDPVMNAYCLADINAGRVYIFDLDRNLWVGYWDKPLRGVAAQHIFGQPFMDRWFGWENRLCRLSASAYDDDGEPITCNVQTIPSDSGKPEAKKQLNGVFFCGDAEGVEINIRVRDTTNGTYTTHALGTTDGNGWVRDFEPIIYRERIVEASFEASAGACFKMLLIDEQETGDDL